MPLPTVGSPAPELSLKSHLDAEFSLSEQRGHNVVVAFFPLAWTPV